MVMSHHASGGSGPAPVQLKVCWSYWLNKPSSTGPTAPPHGGPHPYDSGALTHSYNLDFYDENMDIFTSISYIIYLI